MRLLVISDTHGRPLLIDRVLQREKEASEVFFLGDVVRDIESIAPEYTDRRFHTVRGNCDYFCSYPEFDIVKCGDISVYMTHGHIHSVKRGTQGVLTAARNVGAQVALYGHTHAANIAYEDGVYLINPGSLALPRDSRPSYAVIDIDNSGILPAIKHI